MNVIRMDEDIYNSIKIKSIIIEINYTLEILTSKSSGH